MMSFAFIFKIFLTEQELHHLSLSCLLPAPPSYSLLNPSYIPHSQADSLFPLIIYF